MLKPVIPFHVCNTLIICMYHQRNVFYFRCISASVWFAFGSCCPSPFLLYTRRIDAFHCYGHIKMLPVKLICLIVLNPGQSSSTACWFSRQLWKDFCCCFVKTMVNIYWHQYKLFNNRESFPQGTVLDRKGNLMISYHCRGNIYFVRWNKNETNLDLFLTSNK